MEIEIGRGKKGRRAYGFDDIAIVPSRRTRDPEDVDLTWTIGEHEFSIPILASAMDGVVDVTTAVALGKLGGLGVLNLEGIQVRYDDPAAELERIAGYDKAAATQGLQEIYQTPPRQDLIARRIREIKDAGVVACGSFTPQKVRANIVLYFAIASVMSVLSYLFAGVLTWQSVKLSLLIGPAFALGLFAGLRLFGLANEAAFRRICYGLIAGAAIVGLPALDGIFR